jgi:sporulation protein YunB
VVHWQGKSRPTWRTYLGLILLILVLFAVLATMVMESRLAPVLHTWARTKAVNLATSAINLAVAEIMAGTMSSAKIASVIRDEVGSLQGVQYDMGEINRVSSQASQMILQALTDLGEEAFSIPVGLLSGLDFLAAWGPGIPVRMIPAGALTAKPVASFESAGINQTWHRVFLDLQVTMRVAAPLMVDEIVVAARIPIVEEVFMGAVPSWYFAGQENLTLRDGRLEFPLN